ncbi:hypothetical protein K438DRAFT_1558992 [Mycena galopus ATCC 62051]|nr:hypothetical protein K438DRAFT_1558992 [Mycena galopus ATCC 62051]
MSCTTEPPAKRKRAGDPGASDATPVHSKIWMPYDDVILKAVSTQFRMNHDILAQQSSVFGNMFSMPLPPDKPTVEGCPIVRISDSAQDWELLLEMLYRPYVPYYFFNSWLSECQFRFSFQVPAIRPFDAVTAMLRLGQKYNIAEARDDALSCLHNEFPSDASGIDPLTRIGYQAGLFPDILNLLYECGVHSCIPTAGLNCLNDQLFTGIDRHDGSRTILSSDTKLTLTLALERILFFKKDAMNWLKGDAIIPHQSCQTPKACIQQKMVINHVVTWVREDKHDVSYILGGWDRNWLGKLCDACEAAAKDCVKATSSNRKGWELLPTFFGLSVWKDLKDSD